MNIIYDRKTLKVISLLNNTFYVSGNKILQQMFPKNFDNLAIWQIDKNIDYNLIHLGVKINERGNPCSLYYRGKEIYKLSEQQEQQEKLGVGIDKTLMASDGIIIKKEFSDFLMTSPYTKKETAINFSDGLIPYKTPISAIIKGFFKVSTGYSSICRNVLLRLHNYGIFAKPDYLPSHSDIDPRLLNYLSKYEALKFTRRSKEHVKVLICTPLPGMFNDFKGRKIIYTMMETETLSPSFANGCNEYDEVWVPCNHNHDLFVNGGVKVPVHVIPLGVDERFYFGDNQEKINIDSQLLPLLGNGKKKFKFISLFQWYSRKCPDILIKSFVKAFDDKDDVCLVVVSHHVPFAQIMNEVRGYAKSIRNSNFPSILLYDKIPTDSQLPSVYKSCDAFISTSRGEGFSLPPVEAAACGLPVISSYHTSMKDYLRDDNSYKVNVSKTEITPPNLTAMCGWGAVNELAWR